MDRYSIIMSMPETLEDINAEYEALTDEAQENAKEEAQSLSDSIEYYQSHSLEEIIEYIKAKARDKFGKINGEASLKRALQKEYEGKSNSVVPESILDEVINTTNPETKRKLIEKYKTQLINDYVEKEKKAAIKSIEMFSAMSEQQKNEYVALFQDMILAGNLYNARKEAIIKVSKRMHIHIPECVKKPYVAGHKIEKINKIEMQDKEDIEFKERFLNKINEIKTIIDSQPKIVKWIIIFSVLSSSTLGSIVSMGTMAVDTPLILSFVKYVLTSSLALGFIGSVFHRDDIEKMLHDKKILGESKKLGLFDMSLNWFKATEKFTKYESLVFKDNNEVEITGGNHGLYQ